MSPISARRHSVTVLRLAHNRLFVKDSVWLLVLLSLFLFVGCTPSGKAVVDQLNAHSYACHYRNIDSTEVYAQQALNLAASYSDGRAEALNNLAFVSMVRMDYKNADSLLQEIVKLTDNQVELLVAEVQQMRLCQRRSNNRAFYEHRERAIAHQKRINEERFTLSEHLQQRMVYAESELAIVNSTYYYYVGLERQSVEALLEMDIDQVRHDTAQYLNYLYNVGAGGIITEGSPEDIFQEEINALERCLNIAIRSGYIYFEANAKEALAEHTNDLMLAEEALQLFTTYGDVYQIAGAHRTLASCYHSLGNELQAAEHLGLSLVDQRINQAPDLVASIYEQLSVVNAAVNDKPQSDYYRNLYIDLQEQTRQDRELEARAGILETTINQLNWMIIAVVGAIVLLLFLLWLFNYLNRKRKDDHQLDEVLEQKDDELRTGRLNLEKLERRHLEQRAKVSLVNSITPFIDRILYSVDHLGNRNHSDDLANEEKQYSQEELDYIRELTDKINEQNDLLTQWIQLRQGELSLHIESFPLQPLFELVNRGRASFDMKGVTLIVEPTEAVVKADRVLTLFMLNTLADNARKFTDKGGQVVVSATEHEAYVELSVNDTGCGMNADRLAHVFDNKPIHDDGIHHVCSHGFGLMNCKGIIEKYRKMSQLFSVCLLSAESEEGRGSRFFFRLPKGVKRIVMLLVMLHSSLFVLSSQAQDYMSKAHIFADSAYFSNVNGDYQRTLQFADSCRYYLNLKYRLERPKGRLLMVADDDTSVTPPEIQWLHDSIDVNYQIILDIRNESAVAALALHEWHIYAYNNKVYTQLFKELSADNTLADYCRQMQQSQQNKRIAVILLVVTLLLIIPAYYMLYYRHRLYSRHRRERMQLDNIEMADDELRRIELERAKLHVVNAVLDNCLSTLKHETMYYPSRIRQLVDTNEMEPLREVAHYYRDLYGILSEQAMRQIEQVKLHITAQQLYGQWVLGDANMLNYLFELLKPAEVKAETKDDKYVAFHVTVRASLSTLTSLLARQIVRDHGEATHRRGCGIIFREQQIIVTLPVAKNVNN